MKTLLLLTLLLSAAAWVSYQGESRATANTPSEIPLAEEGALPPIHISAPKPVLATPPGKTEPKKPPSALEAAIESGDVCATARLLNNNLNNEQIFEAYLGATSPGTAVLEVYGAKGPYFAKENSGQKFQSMAARTLWAAKLAGMAYTANNVSEDLAAAHALLVDLGKKEPGNGFYPFLRLHVESRLGYAKDKLLATADEIANSSTFDSHLDEVANELREASWANPATRYAFNYFYSPAYLQYYQAGATLKAVENFSGFARVAQLMTEPGLHSTHRAWDADYDITRYNTGRSLDHEAHYPDTNELRSERGSVGFSYGPTVSGAAADCDPAPYENYFYEQREAR
jgi:hypothetical protein